ncbi:MAG: ABC transporter permease [Candidatus Rokuibacteriota bacterium]
MPTVLASAGAAAPSVARSLSPGRLAWRAFLKNRPAVVGMMVVALFVVTALAGVALTRGQVPVLDPREVRLPDRLKPPFSRPDLQAVPADRRPPTGVYLLGTDELGRDVFARMLEGAFVSLSVGFVAVGIAVALGCLLGGIAGHYGRARIAAPPWAVSAAGLLALCAVATAMARGARAPDVAIWAALGSLLLATGLIGVWRRSGSALTVDTLITGAIDVMLSFPVFFLILTVIAILRPSIWNIMIVIGLTSWQGTARFVRAEILSLREQEFVQAAAAAGTSGPRTIRRHLLPNAVAPVLVSATLSIGGAILTESALSFLGFGVPPPDATWGNIIADGRKYLFDAAWLTLVPGTAIFVVVLAFTLFAEGLRDAFNPKLREG